MKRLSGQPAVLLIVGLLVASILHSLSEIHSLALAHWAQPNLFGDSFAFVFRSSKRSVLAWLFDQHNEHRIVWAKAASLVETELLNLPPGQSALFQILALILGCAGLWSWLCRRLLQRNDLRLLTTLSGWLLLLNPWQYENLGWEFQTPWFLINALVLLGALLLSAQGAGLFPPVLLAMLLPWIALTSTGQGVAVVIAFAVCSWMHSPRLGAFVSGSTALAGLLLFVALPYNKVSGHPELSFQLDYFFRALLGGPWQGLALLCLVIAAVILGRCQAINRRLWPALFMPGLFSILFAGMITLSRSGFGLEQADSSRYISHSLMLGLTAILALALIDDRNNQPRTPLLGGFLVLISTLGSFPQCFQPSGLTYSAAWAEAKRWSIEKRERFTCQAIAARLKSQQILLTDNCKELHPELDRVNQYFQFEGPVKPLGWHQQLIDKQPGLALQPVRATAIEQQLDEKQSTPRALVLRGWAFVKTKPNQPLYLLASYGEDQRMAAPVNVGRRDVRRAFQLPSGRVGFNATFPRSLNGQRLQSVSVAGSNTNVQIWEDPSADG